MQPETVHLRESGGQHCIVAHPGESRLQQAAETCGFSQVPPQRLFMGL